LYMKLRIKLELDSLMAYKDFRCTECFTKSKYKKAC
jgi:hypothetical protein